MQPDLLKEYVTRQKVMELLTSEEAARLSSHEAAESLQDGEEYLDVEHVTEGVQRASTSSRPTGRVIPRAAVHTEVWRRMLAFINQSAPMR